MGEIDIHAVTDVTRQIFHGAHTEATGSFQDRPPGISPKMMGNHLHSIFAKLGVPNRQRAIAMLRGEI